MSLNVTLNLPPDIERMIREETPNLDADVRETYALELFRRGKLSHYELSRTLGLDRFETDALLQRHKIYEGALTMEDLEEQSRTLEEVMRKHQQA